MPQERESLSARSVRRFEVIVKAHVDAGAQVATAIGRAIEQDPLAYGEYLERQKHETQILHAEPREL